MTMGRLSRATFLIAFFLTAVLALAAQEQNQPSAVTPAARLARAKNVFIRNGGGSDVPYNVISMSFADWERFVVVDDPQNADLVVTVTSPDDGKKKDEGGSGFGVSAQGKQVGGGYKQPSAPPSDRSDVLLAVADAKTKVTLWSATEQPKGVEKGRSRADKLVAAANRLMSRFRERISPAPTQ